MLLKYQEVFKILRDEGLPLFVSFRQAFPLLNFPSERALAASVRRGTCPIQEEDFAGKKGFRLAAIAIWQVGIPPKKQRGRPTVEARIAARGEK